jgi:hypothetical protein
MPFQESGGFKLNNSLRRRILLSCYLNLRTCASRIPLRDYGNVADASFVDTYGAPYLGYMGEQSYAATVSGVSYAISTSNFLHLDLLTCPPPAFVHVRIRPGEVSRPSPSHCRSACRSLLAALRLLVASSLLVSSIGLGERAILSSPECA